MDDVFPDSYCVGQEGGVGGAEACYADSEINDLMFDPDHAYPFDDCSSPSILLYVL